jgi:hypothetical protein
MVVPRFSPTFLPILCTVNERARGESSRNSPQRWMPVGLALVVPRPGVLEGEYEFLVEGRALRAGAGSLLYVPRGNLHAHRNTGEGVGRMLVSQTPGGSHERFFEEIGEERRDVSTTPVPEDPPDMERIARIAVEYGIEMPLPGRSYDGREGIAR